MIAAVITSYNSDKIFRCYNSIKKQTNNVIIIDNGTRDNSILSKLRKIQFEEKNTFIIFNSQNLGIAKALNQGLKLAKDKKFEWVLILDQDSEVPENSVKEILADFESLDKRTKSKTAIVALKYLERNLMKVKTENKSLQKFDAVKYVMTSGNFLNLSVLPDNLFFEEKLFIDQVDNDFCFRLRKNGFILLQSCRFYIIHEIGFYQKKLAFAVNNYTPIRRYYLSRNCVYILKKYLLFDFLSVLKIFTGSIFGGLFKIVFFEKQKLKKVSFTFLGIFDGLANNYGKKFEG
jgi:rhamnosyltransferase